MKSFIALTLLLITVSTASANSAGVWVLLSPPLVHDGPVASELDHIKWFYITPDPGTQPDTSTYYADGDFETLSACHNERYSKQLEYLKKMRELDIELFDHTPTAKELADMKKNAKAVRTATPQEKSFAVANYQRYQIALCVWRAK